MREISERDVVAAIGPADELIIRETVRTKASLLEFRRALAFVREPVNADAGAYRALASRVRRLVDLLSVALERGQRSPRKDAAAPGPRHAARSRHHAA